MLDLASDTRPGQIFFNYQWGLGISEIDQSEAEVEIDIQQQVTSDECDTKSDYFRVIHPK